MLSPAFRHSAAVIAISGLLISPALSLPTSQVSAVSRAGRPAGQAAAGKGALRAAAREELARAEELLRRRKPERALVRLSSALELFSRAGDGSGGGTVHELTGDVYRLAGQYLPAVTEYRKAAAEFRAVGQVPHARLALAKAGEVSSLSGDADAARAAFAEGADVPQSVRGAAQKTAAPSAEATKVSAGSGAVGEQKSADAESEMRAFDLVNAARQAKGLPPLVWDLKLTLMARGHAANMARDGFFSHVDRVGNNMVQRAQLFEVRDYEELAENLGNSQGYEDPVAFAVERWVNHEGHRENILNARFTHAGLGMARAADGTVLFTEVFIQFVAAAAAAAEADYRDFIAYATSEFGLGRLDYRGGLLREARARFTNVLTAAAENTPFGRLAQPRRFRAVALTSLGDVAFSEGDLAAAVRLYTQAIETAVRDGRPDLTWAAYRGLGRAHRAAAGREADPVEALRLRGEALSAYARAVTAISALLLGSPRSEEARKSFLADTGIIFTEASGAFAEAALMSSPGTSSPPAGAPLTYAERGLQYSELGRARALLDLLGDARAEIVEGFPPELMRRRADLLARWREIGRLIAGTALTPNAVEALEAEAEQLERDYAGVEESLRVQAPKYASLTKPQPVTLEEIRRSVLGEQSVLLEYSLGAEGSYLWAVTADSLYLYKLPPSAVIEAMAAGLRAKLVPSHSNRALTTEGVAVGKATRGLTLKEAAAPAPAAAGDYAAAAHDLYRVLLGPAAHLTAGKRLLVVADGGLNYIPFEALVTAEGGADYAALPYVIRSNEVEYAPSASVLAALGGRGGKAAGGRMLVVADPVFEDSDPRAKQAPAAKAGKPVRSLLLVSALADVFKSALGVPRLVRLPGSRDEAQSIAKLTNTLGAPATVRLDFDASETFMSGQDLRGYDFLHIATHGILNAERPQFSGLALSLLGDVENDGFLSVDEIFNLRVGARLVVLSACETGLGELRRGEGVSGFTQGFMYAGASQVMVTLWPISDTATAHLMPGFYKRLLSVEKPAVAAALRAAQLEMVEGGRYSAPFYWAPFVLMGGATH